VDEPFSSKTITPTQSDETPAHAGRRLFLAWSTNQLAKLAGSTVKAIRHYHEIGLLDEPDRASNNYKQYGVSHLVRLLQITRLTDLDVPLAQIALMDQGDAASERTLLLLDADLAATIDRLNRVRSELALILRNQSSTDLPIGFGPAASDLSEADRALILIYSRVFAPAEMQELFQMLIDMGSDPIHKEFGSLPADADEATRQSLAERYAPHFHAMIERYPRMKDPLSRAPRGPAFASNTIGQAIAELYNEAQLDALQRMGQMIEDEDKRQSTESAGNS